MHCICCSLIILQTLRSFLYLLSCKDLSAEQARCSNQLLCRRCQRSYFLFYHIIRQENCRNRKNNCHAMCTDRSSLLTTDSVAVLRFAYTSVTVLQMSRSKLESFVIQMKKDETYRTKTSRIYSHDS